MAKTAGLGDNLYVAGFDIGGDTNSVGKISGGPVALDVTDVTQSGHSRLGGERDGGIDFTAYHDAAVGASHDALSPLPTADAMVTYFRGGVLGNPAASMVAKQVNYDPTRATDGSLTFAVSTQAHGFGLEWGVQLTPARRVDGSATAAGPSNSFDTGGAPSFCAPAHFHLFAFPCPHLAISLFGHPPDNT